MGSTRIKGNKKPLLKLGAPGTEYATDLTAYTIENGGDRQFYFRGSAAQSTAKNSFWRYVWESAGDEVPYTVAPHGNAVPTDDEPHFVGTLTIGNKPTIGVEASTSRSAAGTFDFEFEIDGEPTLDTGV